MRPLGRILCVFTATFSLGCGTCCNMTSGSGGPIPFGGVVADVSFAGQLVVGVAQGKGEAIGFAPLGLALMAVDIPLSAVGDVVTMPWVATHIVKSLQAAPATDKVAPSQTAPAAAN